MSNASTLSNGTDLWPALIYAVFTVLLVAAIVILSHLLGERHTAPGLNQPYESGIRPTGSARLHFDAHYYLVGVFFVLFDVEAAIVIAWAVAFRELGWAGYAAATLFMVTLAFGLIYVWKLGGFDWYTATGARFRGDRR